MAITTFTNGVTLTDEEWFNHVDTITYDGATTQILVGGGAGTIAAWTTATGTGSPVRAASPTFTGTVILPTVSAFTLGGTISGGANQINNVVIGAVTPLAGSFTTGSFTGLVDLSCASAGQIQFPATANSSANANTLDDYDEYTAASTACTGAIT